MNNFTFYSPTYFVFGKDKENSAGKYVKRFGGSKVLIHYGGGSVVRTGLLDRVKASLEADGIAYVELGGVQPNPRSGLVYEGIDLCRREGVDFILAVGGGSTIDSAKAIAADRGHVLKSVVLPRNQSEPPYTAVLRDLGFTSYRDEENDWIHEKIKFRPLMRALRLADVYLPLTGHGCFTPKNEDGIVNIVGIATQNGIKYNVIQAVTHNVFGNGVYGRLQGVCSFVRTKHKSYISVQNLFVHRTVDAFS